MEDKLATGRNTKRVKKYAGVYEAAFQTKTIEEANMTLNCLTQTQIEQLIQSMEVNPTIEAHIKEPTLQWCRLQLTEQKQGGAWKRRIREAGHVI
jgi:DNA replication protein DnaD